MNELSMPKQASSIITVIGVGGAGGNALNYMWRMGIKDVNFLACNTDQGALDNLDIPAENKIVMGPGLGAGNDPDRGRDLAMEALDEIREHLEARKTKMVFIAAGMGGGTGTGASPVIAKLAHEMGLLTVANVTLPLLWEGTTRCEQAARGVEELRKYADSLLVINNESIREMYGKLPVSKAFGKADDILASATKGIAELITVKTAFIRVDFADLERVMRGSGRAHMGVASAEGEGRALEAARRSLCSPLLNSNLISGAKKILLNVAAANIDDISYDEAMEVLNYIQSYASCKDEAGVEHKADIIWGVSAKPMPEGYLEVVVVATGFNEDNNVTPLEPIIPSFVTVVKEDDEPADEPSIAPKKGVLNPPPRTDMPAVLERKQSKYSNIKAELSIPAYQRRNMKLVVRNDDGVPRRKQEIRDDNVEVPSPANDNKLF
ncbi:MAG: cell division protein FtsZ [Alistipes sp.]|nr:cell division protein FtsZ [Alistipes sp.]MBP3600803.1 cell division protein FtsZ [Alistipes sp.]MBR3912354.1 cell division protein FtsZ [Alistipes sp.]